MSMLFIIAIKVYVKKQLSKQICINKNILWLFNDLIIILQIGFYKTNLTFSPYFFVFYFTVIQHVKKSDTDFLCCSITQKHK